jgi:site-specific recombinase XerC
MSCGRSIRRIPIVREVEVRLGTGGLEAIGPLKIEAYQHRCEKEASPAPLTRNGVDVVTVKELLGHTSILTTMRYAHSNFETKARAVAGFATSDKIVTILPRRARNEPKGIVTMVRN